MASIYLIRHAQASFDGDDYDQLSSLGIEQSHRLGEQLAERGLMPKLIHCGLMRRHRQTLEHCRERAFAGDGIRVDHSSAWNEYDHHQVLAGLDSELATPAGVRAFLGRQPDPKLAFRRTFQQAVERWISGMHDQDYDETWSTFKARVNSALDEALNGLSDNQACSDQQAVIFTSGGPIAALILALMGLPDQMLLKLNWTLVNCGITKLVTSSSGIFISTINEHGMFESPEYRRMITYR